jgi:formamidopyrimidine-DNA glycosylase
MKLLNEEVFIRMYQAIIKVFPAVIANGGKNTEKDLYGNYGGYLTHVSKNTQNKPCDRCGGIIVKEAYLGGSVYYCPDCQR